MAFKNFSLAFQIGAVFHGNKAFTDAIIQTKELSQTMKECRKQMKMVDAAYDKGVLGLASKINAQHQIGKAYADKMGEKGRYEKLAQTQNKFESSYGSMTKYGTNTFQFAEMAKGVLSFSNAAAEFETKLSKVQAITGGTTDDMKILEKTALDLGSKTKYTASQAAEAMSFLGMAGWKTNQIVSAMPGLLDLAAASGEDLANVADILSDDLTAFGMKAEEAGHMADVFAVTSSNANTNVALMGETFKYAGAVAGALGYKLEDVALATGLMANAGIKGSQAGTSLRSIFTRLAKPTKEVEKGLAEIGLKADDLAGKPLSEIITKFRKSFDGLNETQKAQAAAQIAGQEAMSGFLSIINASDKDLNNLSGAIAKSNGKVTEMAEVMRNNAKGNVESFKSALETLQITIGKTLLPVLAEGAKGATEFVKSIGNFANEYPSVVGGITGIALGVFALGAAGNGLMWVFAGLKTVYNGAQAALAFYNMVAKSSTAISIIMTAKQWLLNAAMWACPIVWFMAGFMALIGVGWLIVKNWDTIKETAINMWNEPGKALEDFGNLIQRVFTNAWNWVTEKWGAIKNLLSTPIFGSVNIAAKSTLATREPAQSNNPNDYVHNATGGIYGKGAFLTTFAEDSGESAIPHTPNAHNIGLLAKTNEIMGNPLGGNNISVNFAPVINASGGTDAATIQSAIADERRRLETMLKDLMSQQRRVSYA